MILEYCPLLLTPSTKPLFVILIMVPEGVLPFGCLLILLDTVFIEGDNEEEEDDDDDDEEDAYEDDSEDIDDERIELGERVIEEVF